MGFETAEIKIDTTALTNDEWKKIMDAKLNTATHFEIHCWNEEQEELEMALQYGTIQTSDWEYGKIVAGTVTAAFTDYLLSLPKPVDTDIYNKMTPFFSIFLDNGFSSEHYGTELNQVSESHL